MNINDLKPGTYKPVEQKQAASPSSGNLNINDLPAGSYKPAVKENNIAQSIFTNTIGRAAVRLPQALVGGAVNLFGNDQQKKNFQDTASMPVTLPLGLGTVAPQKHYSEGGIKQIALDTGKSALDIATLGEGGAANALLKKGASRIISPIADLAAKSPVAKWAISKVPGVAANIAEGVGYNSASNALNEKPISENT